MPFALPDDSHVSATIEFVDDAVPPNVVPAPAGAAAVWSSSDATVITVVPDPADATGMTALVTSTGKLGVASVMLQVTVPGDPHSPYTGVGGDVTVGAGALSAIDMKFGVPVHN
jgi:hypothetical protein